MDEQERNRGAAEDMSDAPATPAEDNEPASAMSTPGGDAHARGAAEEAAGSPRTEK